VHSFSGHALDIEAIGTRCRRAGVWLIANTTQALGARPLALAGAPVDAVANSGWKWLCGPYATGFAWIRPELVGVMRRTQAYWLSMQTADDLSRSVDPRVPERLEHRHLDVFGTANFFNFHAFLASLTYLEAQGLRAIEIYVQALVSRLVGELDPAVYQLVSRKDGPRRSSLVVFGHRDAARTPAVHQRLLDAGIVTALRRGNIRVAPHLYNLESEVDRLLEVLQDATKAV
jgi:selenocysteine lyase/cysteine desulfurase